MHLALQPPHRCSTAAAPPYASTAPTNGDAATSDKRPEIPSPLRSSGSSGSASAISAESGAASSNPSPLTAGAMKRAEAVALTGSTSAAKPAIDRFCSCGPPCDSIGSKPPGVARPNSVMLKSGCPRPSATWHEPHEVATKSGPSPVLALKFRANLASPTSRVGSCGPDSSPTGPSSVASGRPHRVAAAPHKLPRPRQFPGQGRARRVAPLEYV